MMTSRSKPEKRPRRLPPTGRDRTAPTARHRPRLSVTPGLRQCHAHFSSNIDVLPSKFGRVADFLSSSLSSARRALARQLMGGRKQVNRVVPPPLRALSKQRALSRPEAEASTERELFEVVYERMGALARGASDFDDLVQLAAEQVFRSLPSFAGRSEIETWIFGVCYRVLLSQRRWYWRFRQRFSSDPIAIESRVDEALPDAHESLEAEQRLALLQRAL